MKRLLSLLLVLSCLCTYAMAEPAPTAYPQLGLEIQLPEAMEETGLTIISTDQLLNLLYQHGEETTALLLVERVNADAFSLMTSDAQMAAILAESRMQHLGTQDDTAYILFHAAAAEDPADYFSAVLGADFSAFSAEMQEGIRAALPHVKAIADSIRLIPVEKAEIALTAFTTRDLQGNEVTEQIFAGKDLTVVNVWGTFCGPCINEMPALAAWEKELPENVQIIGIVSDVGLTDDPATARAITEKTGVTFRNLLVSDDLQSFLSLSPYVPTTYFLDANGVSVGEPVVGAYVDQYKQFVEDYLK